MTSQPAPKKKRNLLLMGCAGFGGLFLVCVVIGALNRPATTGGQATAVAVDRATAVPEKDRATTTPAPIDTNPTVDPMTAAMADLPGYVSRATMGSEWPLTIEQGVLSCIMPGKAIILIADGATYAVNSPAREGSNRLPSWKDIMDVREGEKDLSPLIDEGLELCK